MHAQAKYNENGVLSICGEECFLEHILIVEKVVVMGTAIVAQAVESLLCR